MEGNLDKTNLAFKALSDPTRRRILGLLKTGDRESKEIAKHCDQEWSTVSRHLRILEVAGLVTSTRSGTHISYSIVRATVERVVSHVNQWI